MRRILLVLTATALVVVVMATTAVFPVFAAKDEGPGKGVGFQEGKVGDPQTDKKNEPTGEGYGVLYPRR